VFIPLIFALLFLAGALVNTFGADRNPTEAMSGYLISLGLLAAGHFIRQNNRQSREFCDWLLENQAAVKAGSARYNGAPIDEQTVLVQYQAAMSFLVVSIKASSRFYLAGEESSLTTAARFSLCSLLLGWWGLPWGPVYTVSSVFSNLRGGKRRNVRDVLDELTGYEKEVVQLTERAAENARRIMVERGFPAGSAMQVEASESPGSYRCQISYDDQPPIDGSVWKNECHGVTVIVRKGDRSRLEGLLVDFIDGEFRFQPAARGTRTVSRT